MNAATIIQRPCKCGCGTTFTPHPKQPGREYIYGHKPRFDAPIVPSNVIRTKFGGRTEDERKRLDYKLALMTARQELSEVAKQIDLADDRIADIRSDLKACEAHKEALTDRHLTIDSTIMALEALIEGKSLAREVAALTTIEGEAI
jgi:hypothetical protein